ncbi:MAG: peptidylprolyl isomerase, partial [Alistipes sp.]
MKQYAVIATEKGEMKVELYTDATPGTVANFVKLANEKFYDGLTF